MSESRRGRPTIRCLLDDLGLDLPELHVDLGELDHPWLQELRRITPDSPKGQKRILSIGSPLVFRLRISGERGATWLDESCEVVWLCGVHCRGADSDDDAFSWFADLHANNHLLPSDDDRLRDQAEAVIRLERAMCAELIHLVDEAGAQLGTEVTADLAGWIPSRVMVIESGGVEEIWCALSGQSPNGTFVPEAWRELLFAALADHLSPTEFEVRNDWPTGSLQWCEAVRFGLR